MFTNRNSCVVFAQKSSGERAFSAGRRLVGSILVGVAASAALPGLMWADEPFLGVSEGAVVTGTRTVSPGQGSSPDAVILSTQPVAAEDAAPPAPQAAPVVDRLQAAQEPAVAPVPPQDEASQEQASEQQDAQQPVEFEPLQRGPIHEGYAEPVEVETNKPLSVPKEPPPPVEEIPPEIKPDEPDIEWIPGYWAWDDDREDFIWISGIWRKPPKGRTWAQGRWEKTEAGYRWIPGRWVPAQGQQAEVLPLPPESLDTGPNSDPPAEDRFWVPGSWQYRDGRYVWRPGFWARSYDQWVWVPDHYVPVVGGCYYVPGYWDYPLERRGILFAPYRIIWHHHRHHAIHFSPSVVVDVSGAFFHLWVRPSYGHYFFGDYYDDHYVQLGFYPWFAFVTYNGHHHRRYDPLFSYYHHRYRHDHHVDLYHELRDRHEHFRRHRDERPAHTYRPHRRQTGDAGHRAPAGAHRGDRGDRHAEGVLAHELSKEVVQSQMRHRHAQQAGGRAIGTRERLRHSEAAGQRSSAKSPIGSARERASRTRPGAVQRSPRRLSTEDLDLKRNQRTGDGKRRRNSVIRGQSPGEGSVGRSFGAVPSIHDPSPRPVQRPSQRPAQSTRGRGSARQGAVGPRAGRQETAQQETARELILGHSKTERAQRARNRVEHRSSPVERSTGRAARGSVRGETNATESPRVTVPQASGGQRRSSSDARSFRTQSSDSQSPRTRSRRAAPAPAPRVEARPSRRSEARSVARPRSSDFRRATPSRSPRVAPSRSSRSDAVRRAMSRGGGKGGAIPSRRSRGGGKRGKR